MKLRHFGQNDEKQGECVKYKVVRIVLGEKTEKRYERTKRENEVEKESLLDNLRSKDLVKR